MGNWKKVKLSEIMSPCSDSEYIIDVQNEHYITLSLYGKGAHERQIKDGKYPVPFLGYRVRSGQFIYSRIDARNGAYDIIGQELDGFVVSKDFPVYDIDTEIVLPRYLLRSVLSTGFINQVKHSSFGATNRMRIKEDVFANYSIMLPPKDQQQTIVAILDQVSAIIENRQQQLSTLDDLIKARFVEMFGDCRINPKAWNTVELGEISDVGSSKRVFVEELRETGIPFYRGTEVGALAEGKAITPELFITREHYEELIEATGTPLVGDLLMPSICPDGRIWVVDTEEPFYFKDGRVLWVHSISKEFDPVFLLYTLKDRIMTDYSSIASGTTFAELKIFALKQCRVFAVPMDLQKQFVSFVKQIDKSK